MYCGKSGSLSCHGGESSFRRRHLSRSTSARLSVFNTTPVSACPPTLMHTHKHLQICRHTSNATKNNLAIHRAPLLPFSCHFDWQRRSRLMRQQNKALIITHYCNSSLCMCCFNPNVMHVHAVTGVRSFICGRAHARTDRFMDICLER